MSSATVIPPEVLLPIFSLLDPETLKSCRLVSPAWNQLILEKLAGDRFVLRARKLEISEELAGEFAKADSRLWRNVSYHGDLHDEAQHPEGYDDHGLQVFFRTMRRQGANGPWEEVRSLDVFVRNTREFWALETAANTNLLRNIETLTVRFMKEYGDPAVVVEQGVRVAPGSLPNLTRLRVFNPYRLNRNPMVKALIHAAPNLSSLFYLSRGMELPNLKTTKLSHLEGNWISSRALSSLQDSLVSLTLTNPVLRLDQKLVFPAVKELRLLDTEDKSWGHRPAVAVNLFASFPNLEKLTCLWKSTESVALDSWRYFQACRRRGYEGLSLRVVDMFVPDPRRDWAMAWDFFRKFIRVVPDFGLEKLTLLIQPQIVAEATEEELLLLLDIRVPLLVLEAAKPYLVEKGKEPDAFPFAALFRRLASLEGSWGKMRGGILEIRGGGFDAEETGLIDTSSFPAAVRKVQEAWEVVRLRNFLIRVETEEALQAEIGRHGLVLEMLFGFKAN